MEFNSAFEGLIRQTTFVQSKNEAGSCKLCTGKAVLHIMKMYL